MKTEMITDNILAAAEMIKQGGLVAVPTETVYGLAANGLDGDAVERIYSVKGRPENKPLSLMVSGAEAMEVLCKNVPDSAKALAKKFWPGPLTMVLEAKAVVPEIVRAGGETVGLRCPDSAKTLALIDAAGVPLAAPSANPSGRPSPKTAEQVREYFDGRIDAIIDGGECELGVESTVFDMSVTPYRILRRGAASEDEIISALWDSMTIIGITGGTGCGKTTALDAIKELGGLVIDCDEVYHRLLRESIPLLKDIDEAFPGVVEDGVLDTKALGNVVFQDEEKLLMLNLLTHQYVGDELDRLMKDWALRGGRIIAVDAIALIESGVASSCDAVVGITAPIEDRIERLMARDNISREYAEMRINAQPDREYYEENCDYTLCNDGTRDAFAAESRRLFKEIILR